MSIIKLSQVVVALCVLSLLAAYAVADEDREKPPTLTVNGRGVVSATPDRAVVRLGAEIQREEAALAQREVNTIMQEAIAAIRKLDIPQERIRTASLTLIPVYSHPRPIPRDREPEEPRIIGYRAGNVLEIIVDDLTRVGAVIDAGVSAGANRIQGLTFQLRDDREARRRALREAVEDAQSKARTLSEAMKVRLDAVHEIVESDVQVIRPDFAMARVMAEVATPVEPGQVEISAAVVVRYRLADTTRN